MRLRASVRRVTGNARHIVHGRESDDLTSNIAWVEIEPDDGGFFVFYYSSAGECLADGWHESLDQAKHQARFEFEIQEADWKGVS